jgi:hypothetical protein
MDHIRLPPIISHNIYENATQSEFSSAKHTFVVHENIFSCTIYALHTVSYEKYTPYFIEGNYAYL